MKQWGAVLAQCPIFENLSEDAILRVLQEVPYTMERFSKGDVLYRAEDASTRIGIILSGCLEMRKYLPTGNVLSMFQRGSGEMLGGQHRLFQFPPVPL